MTHLDLDQLDESGDIRTIAEEAGAYDPTGSTRRGLVKRTGLGLGALAGGSALLGGLLSPLEAMAQSSTSGAYARSKSASNDVKIGNYALTLEYLESAFYAAAASMGYADFDVDYLAKTLNTHEAAHVKALQGVLGSAAVTAPKLNPTTVAAALGTSGDYAPFLSTAAALEPVGTSAYQGAGPYIMNFSIAKAALSILPVEAYHAGWTATMVRLKGINRGLNPAPYIFNPPFSFAKTVRVVTATNFVDGDLQPS